MPLKKSATEEAFEGNVGEMSNARRGKYGKKKARQIAVAAAFAVKEQARKGKK